MGSIIDEIPDRASLRNDAHHLGQLMLIRRTLEGSD
jgi:hypothetical protein